MKKFINQENVVHSFSSSHLNSSCFNFSVKFYKFKVFLYELSAGVQNAWGIDLIVIIMEGKIFYFSGETEFLFELSKTWDSRYPI